MDFLSKKFKKRTDERVRMVLIIVKKEVDRVFYKFNSRR